MTKENKMISKIKYFAILSILLGLQACATTDPMKLKLDADSGKSAIIAKASGFSGLSDLVLWRFSGTDEEAENPDGTYRTDIVTERVFLNFSKMKNGYVFTSARPGRYFIESAIMQKHWASCFSNATYIFTVEPNTVAYLGNLNLLGNAIELQQRIKSQGDVRISMHSSNYGQVQRYYFNLKLKPGVKPGNDIDIQQAQSYLTESAVDIKVPVKPIIFKPFKFSHEQGLLSKAMFGNRCS